MIASFPGPAQLSVPCSTEKRGEPGTFSHVSDVTTNKKINERKRAKRQRIHFVRVRIGSLVPRPHPKIGKGPGHTCKLSRMC